MTLHKKLQIAVLGSYMGEAVAERDWETDSQGFEYLNFERFTKSWFQLADMWTSTIDEADYVAFLKNLIDRMITLGPDGGLMFREDRDIVPQHVWERTSTRHRSVIVVPNTPSQVKAKYRPSICFSPPAKGSQARGGGGRKPSGSAQMQRLRMRRRSSMSSISSGLVSPSFAIGRAESSVKTRDTDFALAPSPNKSRLPASSSPGGGARRRVSIISFSPTRRSEK